MSPWIQPPRVVPAEAMARLRERWERLANRHGPVVRVLEAGAGVVPGEESVGIAPALAAVVEALPGVALGPVVLDWPQGASQVWPQLEDRHCHQPVWVEGREAVVVRIDPVSGEAGAVLHVRDDLGLDVIAGDVVAWWSALTDWAEDEVPALTTELGPEAMDDEDLETMLEEALEQEFGDWLVADR